MKKIILILLIIFLSYASPVLALGDATITADVNGYPLTIKTTSRLAGAIDSLTWKGKEFVDSYDHGRQIQTAWSVNGLGQCYNPTEAGSAADDTGPTSSSILLDFQTTGTNSYYTKSRPAFWDAPGQSDPDGGCNFSLNGTHGPWLGGTAVNKTIVSDWLLEKWVTIGYAGIQNVVKYVSKITVPANPDIAIDYIILDQPSVHLPVGFSVWKQYDPTSASLVPPSTYYGYSNHPHVLMTSDGNFALSVYSPEIPENGLSGLPQYPYLGYMVSFFLISVNGERIAKTEPFPPGSTHTYVSYIVVGTPEQVRQSLQSLYTLTTPAKACSINLSANSITTGQSVTVNTTGAGGTVIKYISRTDTNAISNLGNPIWTDSSGRKYYGISGSSVSGLAAGDYKLWCGVGEYADAGKCSGNPFCSYEGGNITTQCDGYVSCSNTDNASLAVTSTPLPGVTISDLRSLLQNFTNIFDYNSLVGSFGSP